MLIQIHNNLQHEQELEPRNINPKSISTTHQSSLIFHTTKEGKKKKTFVFYSSRATIVNHKSTQLPSIHQIKIHQNHIATFHSYENSKDDSKQTFKSLKLQKFKKTNPR